MGNNLEEFLRDVVKNMTYLKGVNLIKGKYDASKIMDGADENMNPLLFAEPTLNFDSRDMEGLPIHLYFKIAGDVIKMHYEFRVEAKKPEEQPAKAEANNVETNPDIQTKTSSNTSVQQIQTAKVLSKAKLIQTRASIKAPQQFRVAAKPTAAQQILQAKANAISAQANPVNTTTDTQPKQAEPINMDNVKPLLLSDLEIQMHIKNDDGKETTESLYHNMLFARPQTASGSRDWKSIDEFFSIKSAIEKGNVRITWSGKIQWVDISSPEMQENLKKPDYKPTPEITTVSGSIPIEVAFNSASHISMFDDVKDLLQWDYEILNDKKVYFKDPFKDDAIYFLPQEYRIKALPNNAPSMTTEIISENGNRKVLMRFGIAPYVHPNAKRDAYKIFLKRKGKQYCELRYGGYESARFEWGIEMADGKLYGQNGFTSITSNGNIEAAPESSFFIVLEAPADGLVDLFQDKIMNEGIEVGKVFFTVYDGLKNEKKELDGVPVKLNLHALAGLQPSVEITECKWPNYIAKITNTGSYPIEIGGAALSILRREKNCVKEAKHELKSTAVWPKTLAQGESTTVELSSDQTEAIKHRRIPLFWKINEGYWTDYICEPYHIRLPDANLEEVMCKTNESATFEHKTWELSIIPNFNWYDYPNMTAVQVEIKTKYGLDEKVTLMNDGVKPKIPMVTNLNADQKTQQAGEQIFEYRVRAITTNGPKDPPWCEWANDSGDTLFIYSDDLIPTETENT